MHQQRFEATTQENTSGSALLNGSDQFTYRIGQWENTKENLCLDKPDPNAITWPEYDLLSRRRLLLSLVSKRGPSPQVSLPSPPKDSERFTHEVRV